MNEPKTLASLLDLVRRRPAEPWRDGDNIPWHEPGFSRRMLQEHLSQAHDGASRRFETIDRQVAWIHEQVLGERAAAIVDLGCGPGLYASRLAQRGHTCLGIDYGPASIEYAAAEAERLRLRCTYRCEDIRNADYGDAANLVMLIDGEFNVFRPPDAKAILAKARGALAPGGALLLEPHTFDAVREMGSRPPRWYSTEAGLFSERPHLCLEERAWHEQQHVATARYFIVDAATTEVATYAASYQAYSEADYLALLREVGFESVELLPSLTGDTAEVQNDLMVIVSRKREVST